MLDIITTEFEKIKRYNVLWVGVVAVLFSVLLAVFQHVSSHGDNPLTFESFANGVIWNNFSLAFPFCITLIGGYLINREYTDQTLKNILTVPVSLLKLLTGKLIALGGLTIILSLFSFVCTVILGLIFFHINITIEQVAKSLVHILIVNLCCYVAVLPIIAYFGRKPNAFLTGAGIAFVYGFCGIFVAGRNLNDFYPITVGLGLVGYKNDASTIYHPLIGATTLVAILILTAIIISFKPNHDKIMDNK